MSTLHIQLLGEFRVTYGDELITTSNQSRQQALLAYLLLHRHTPQSRQHLAFLFWPASSESQAHSNLRKLFSQFRQVLPDPDQFLYADRYTIQWKPNAPFTADVDELDQLLKQIQHDTVNQGVLTRLVELYTGELLPGCYDDWLLALRQHYQQSIQHALERLVTLLENQRAYAEGVRYAQRLLELDPLDETYYQRLMRLLALKGNRSGALQVYHDCVKRLKRELGVEPSLKTQQIYEWILNLTLGVPAEASEQPVVADSVALVGRAVEWQQLRAVWQTAVQGHARFVVISGEAGIGKTRLAEELLQWAGYHGILIARTRSYAAQGDLAYTPLTELLRTDPLRARLAKLSDVWLVEVARLLPELLASRPALIQPEPLTENWQRQRFLEALTRAVLVDEQPLLLLFDDLQWCDQETMRWLRYLMHFAPQARLLVVGTVRPEEVELVHPLTALQLDLRRSDQLTEIALPALSQAEVTALAGQLRDTGLTREEADQLYRETEGNPLFVVETVRAGFNMDVKGHGSGEATSSSSSSRPILPSRLPPKAYMMIRSRLAQLSALAQELVSLAATIGRSFTFDVLAAASNQDEETLVNSLDELWRRHVVRDHGANSYDFSHDRIREVAYAEISPTRRRWLHQRIAQALETIYANNLHDISGQLALHCAQAGQNEKAIAYYQQAAETARQIHANEVAIGHYRQALVLVKQLPATLERSQRELRLLIGLGPALRDTKGFALPEIEYVYTQARQLSQQIGDGPAILPILHGLTEFYRVRAEYQKALEVGEQMLALAQHTQADQYLVIAYFQLGMTWFTCGVLASARSYLEQSITCSALHRSYPRLYTRFAHVLWMLGYPEQALKLGQETLLLAQEALRPFEVVDLYGEVLELRLLCGELEGVPQDAEKMLMLIHQYDLDQPLSWATYLKGFALALQGLSEGVIQMHQGLDKHLAMGGMTRRTRFLIWLAEMSMHVGQPEQAVAYLDEATALIHQKDEHFWEAELYRLKGEWLLSQHADEQTAAEAWFQRALDTARQQQAKSLELRAAMSLSRLWQRQGRCNEASSLLSSIYAWFTEGFGMRDLQEARRLLKELS